MSFTYKNWHISLREERMTLAEAYDSISLYSSDATEIPFIVKLFENPASPIAFAGAIDLREHDYIHAIIGRGMMQKDEVFVIGFTMGSTRKLDNISKNIFKFITRFLYPKFYRWSNEDMRVFDQALVAGEQFCKYDLTRVDYDSMLRKSLRDIRKILGINIAELTGVYEEEKKLFDDVECQRLV